MILIKEHEVKDPEGNIILDAIASRFGYRETVIDEEGAEIPNPETKQEFYQQWLLDKTFMEIGSHLINTAANDAATTKQSEIDTTIKPELKVEKK